ncbi:F-box/kelch-repeat protein At1g57790-like [Mercurialis annua]|uniref:F-box/kelch-repeat protein At1g57790-like n=1 Tax=Mercurialis annua TaxID=3986 RepID=UPI002160CCF0|nr:F-box/kelch-repeat protein At1g57790-like [Mercurialis annua]
MSFASRSRQNQATLLSLSINKIKQLGSFGEAVKRQKLPESGFSRSTWNRNANRKGSSIRILEVNLESECDILWKILKYFDGTTDVGAVFAIWNTCKLWRSIIRSFPSFVRYPPSDPRYPYLLSLKDQTCRFVHPFYDHTFCLEFPELLDTHIRFSKFGWLLLTRSDYTHFLFNPFTRHKIDIPANFMPKNHSSQCIKMCFDDRCIVGIGSLGLFLFVPGRSWTLYMFLDNHSWESNLYPKELFHGRDYDMAFHSHPVIHKNKCYILGLDGHLLVFNLNTGKFDFIWKPFLQKKADSVYRSFLVINKGKLLGIFEFDDRNKILIRELKLSSKRWQKVSDIGDKMVYVSYGSSFIGIAPTGVEGGKIYFPQVLKDESVFYSLTSRRYQSSSNSYSSKIPVDVEELANCTWIESLPFKQN